MKYMRLLATTLALQGALLPQAVMAEEPTPGFGLLSTLMGVLGIGFLLQRRQG